MHDHTATIFCVGRELLEGLVLDRNANFMAGKLTDAGCRVLGIQVLDDHAEAMVPAFRAAIAQQPRYLLTTGGMGPGHDDNTRESVAEACGLPLARDEAAAGMLATAYRRLYAKGIVRNPDLNEDRLKMAMLPEGATALENPIGAGPAVSLEVGPTRLFMLPGVPQEMQRMFDLYVLPEISTASRGVHKLVRRIEYPGRDESALSRVLADLSRRYPGTHSRARLSGPDGGDGIRITLYGEHHDGAELEQKLERAEADLRARLGLERDSSAGADTGEGAR